MNNQFSLSSILKAPSRISQCLVASAAALLFCGAPVVHGETWNLTTGGSWATPANWDTTTIPNGVGAVAQFTAINSANRAITLDSGAPGFTVGSISFDVGSSFTNSITTGTGGSNLSLNNGGNGVTIATSGSGSGNNTISVRLTLNDLVTAQVDQTTASSAAGSLNLTAAISGDGGFIKQGDGLATFGTGVKSYLGPTVLNGGRMRISNAAQPSASSDFTINEGAQLELITAGAFSLGIGTLNLNGTGATSGPFAVFPGAIRNTRGLAVTIANDVVLQSNSLIHVQANNGTGGDLNPIGSTTLSGIVSGPGSLAFTAPGSDADQGSLILTGVNTYEGGTFVNGGIVNVNSDNALGLATAPISLSTTISRATLRASGDITTIARTLTLNFQGGTIDTNGHNVTFGGGSTIEGSALRKIGAGRLLIAGEQNYSTLTTEGGRTDIASEMADGFATLNANAETNISVDQVLTNLSIGDGAVVTLSATLPASPAVADGGASGAPSGHEQLGAASETGGAESASSTPEPTNHLVTNSVSIIPEPGSAALLLGGLGVLLGVRRSKRTD